MTLAKALKKKNRLVQKISSLQREVQSSNSSTKPEAERKISTIDSMVELEAKIEDLIKLKTSLFEASTPMRDTILRLAELKSRIGFLNSINTREGKEWTYGDRETEYFAAYDILYVKSEVEKCEKSIDDLQESLDRFNHTTEIEV
jgi:archaellum component FlaC